MNFLSHFYFDRDTKNPYQVIGAALPDLVKNVDKAWNCYPQKHPQLFEKNHDFLSLLTGWRRHLKVDQFFHSSAFFETHTKSIKSLVKSHLENTPIRPSFYAHIALELLLDHLLTLKFPLISTDFYQNLATADEQVLFNFVKLSGVENPNRLLPFLSNFKEKRNLESYNKLDNIAYALSNICTRLWPTPLTNGANRLLTQQLIAYSSILEPDFMCIFEEIESRLQ